MEGSQDLIEWAADARARKVWSEMCRQHAEERVGRDDHTQLGASECDDDAARAHKDCWLKPSGESWIDLANISWRHKGHLQCALV